MAREPKPRLRVSAGSSKSYTSDSFANFSASMGLGASNLSSGSTYTLNPLTRNHTALEFMFRGSWLVRTIIEAVAEDMTREGISIESDMPPDEMDKLTRYVRQMELWQRLCEALKWARLYGGCLAVVMIDGQKTDTPLDIERVGVGQFKGLLILDRWMVWPHLDDPIKELGKNYGLPKFYEVVSDARVIPHLKLHYSRCIRFDGVDLPYWQKMAENFWGLSIIEPLYDRLVAFDSTTQGAAQLVYKAYLRTLKVEKLRELIAFGGPAYDAIVQQLRQIRLYQANEGLTLLDSTDEFETHSYAFGGLSDVMIQFAQQLSGAAQIPLVRLFGQSPAGLNATGDADIRNYYDFINSKQEAMLRLPMQMLLELSHRSLFGEPLPAGFDFSFAPLWQLADTEKATVAGDVTTAVVNAQQAGIVGNAAALKELRQSSKVTGVWSNITDEEIADADTAPPPASELMGEHDQPGAAKPPAAAKPEDEGEQPSDDAADPGRLARSTAVLGLLPEHARKGHPSGLDEPQHLHERYGHLGPMAELRRQFPLEPAATTAAQQIPAAVKLHPIGDALPMLDIHGIPVTIETLAGQAREPGRPILTASYGYFNGTSSHEGPLEQFDAFVGDDKDSEAVWLIEQQDPKSGAFLEFKAMLCFPDRDTAVRAFTEAYNPGGEKWLGKVRRMSVDALKAFLAEWPTGKTAHEKRANGGIQL